MQFQNFTTFFSEHLGVLASYIQQFLTVFRIGLRFGTILVGLWNFGGGLNPPPTPPRYATVSVSGQISCFITCLNNKTNSASHLSKYCHNTFEIPQEHTTFFMWEIPLRYINDNGEGRAVSNNYAYTKCFIVQLMHSNV